jgi:hypothetical protein
VVRHRLSIKARITRTSAGRKTEIEGGYVERSQGEEKSENRSDRRNHT